MLIVPPLHRFRRRAAVPVASPTPPPPPPPPAYVVAGSASGFGASLRFDRAIALVEGAPVDGSILFDGLAPLAVGIEGEDVLAFVTASEMFGGSTWQVVGQPGYLASEVVVPENGVFEGPPPPPPPAVVLNAIADESGCTLEFDWPVVLASSSPDGSILFDGIAPIAVESVAARTLRFVTGNPLSEGSTWQIDAQPAYVSTALAVPQSGVFPPPPPPPPPANITAVVGADGSAYGAINFDAPVTLAEGAVPDDAMLFGGLPATEVWQNGPYSIGILMQVAGELGVTTWAISRQPGWMATEVVWPGAGVLEGA